MSEGIIREGTPEEVNEFRNKCINEMLKPPDGIDFSPEMMEVLLKQWPKCPNCRHEGDAFKFREKQLPLEVILHDHHFLGNPIEIECLFCGLKQDITDLFSHLG